MKIGILTFEQFHGKKNIGSTRIRVKWPVNHWPEAEEFTMGQRYDVVIYQKAYWLEHAQAFKGLKILDICDADFLHWGSRVKQMADNCDAVVTSTVKLAMYMAKITDRPVWCIPDRLDFDLLPDQKKQHVGDTKVALWYGYSENFPMLSASINALLQLKIEELVVIASKKSPYELPPTAQGKIRLVNLPWTEETVNQDLMKADVVINPQLNSGRWKYKSNNKTILAWAFGIPVAHTKEELAALMTEEARIAEGEKRYAQARAEFNVVDSVRDYKNLIDELIAKKKQKQVAAEVSNGA
jgi:hypothetical protein